MSVASFIPIANYLARQGRPNAGMAWWIVTGLFVIGKPIGLLFGPCAFPAYSRPVLTTSSACQVFLISVFPEQDTRPKAVGLSKQVSQCGNFVGSLLFGSVTLTSQRAKYLNLTVSAISSPFPVDTSLDLPAASLPRLPPSLSHCVCWDLQ
jgi:hypothetical protein